jgi:hypothetical protein
MNRTDLLKILKVGLQAASPYNSQPWEFEFKEDRLFIYAKYVKHGFLANFHDGLFYALGAFLENLSEGAKHHHYAMTSRLLSQTIQMATPLCEVTFIQTPQSPEHDISHVLLRCTNRKIYHRQAVPPDILKEMRALFQGGTRQLLDVTGNDRFMNSCALLERVRIANIEFSDDLIDNLCLTPKEAEERRRGLDLRVLELPLLTRLFLRTERNVFFRRTVGRSIIAQKGAETAKKKALLGCPLLIAFQDHDDSPEILVRNWGAIQKILNFLQQHGLSSHLLASSPDLTKIKRGFYPPEQRKILDQADRDIEMTLGIKMQSILTLLRVGYADDCKIKSLRMDPQDLLRPETT